ncbi:MAG: polysaccharide biosynthesis C-terminal domain-containing protein [Clostridia bacterium]|nr:polysaccharide biosynthesis C-terminal domain-containing protein [Clostridia bacterium]
MNGKQLTKLNISVSLLHQLITGICAIVLPRFILAQFGSEVNGLMQSVSQILSYTTLMEMGIGGVVLASLYKPLAENNTAEISSVFNTTKSFFGKISAVFVVFALVLSLVAKFVVHSEFDFIYVSTMVIILAVNTFFNYYFGLPHQLLLKADRRLYVVQSVQIVTTVLNLSVCLVAIKMNASIHMVKLLSAFVFILNPVCYRLYIKKHYEIVPTKEKHPLAQKKDAVIHHLAYFIHRNTDIVIISVFSTLSAVSVYSVYNSVILIIENLLNAISAGVAGTIGNRIAKGEKKSITESFELYEGVNTCLTAAIFTVAAIMILPFVRIYTLGVTDAEYIQPVFACVMLLAGVMYSIRIPYGSIISAAGHYKETRTGAILEVCLNLVISILLIKPLGISGVAIGTFVAMTYRTFYVVWYLSKNILHRPVLKFVKSFGVNMVVGIVLVCLSERFLTIEAESLLSLVPYGIGVSAVVFGALAIVNIITNYDLIKKIRR